MRCVNLSKYTDAAAGRMNPSWIQEWSSVSLIKTIVTLVVLIFSCFVVKVNIDRGGSELTVCYNGNAWQLYGYSASFENFYDPSWILIYGTLILYNTENPSMNTYLPRTSLHVRKTNDWWYLLWCSEIFFGMNLIHLGFLEIATFC